MLITIGVILVAMIAVAALEIWLFWRLGERDDRRRSQDRSANRPWTGARDEVTRRTSSGRIATAPLSTRAIGASRSPARAR